MGDNDNPQNDHSFRIAGDPRVIDMNDPAERLYWCKSLGISELQLITLVTEVGCSAQKVKDAIAREPDGRSGGNLRP